MFIFFKFYLVDRHGIRLCVVEWVSWTGYDESMVWYVRLLISCNPGAGSGRSTCVGGQRIAYFESLGAGRSVIHVVVDEGGNAGRE